MTFQRAESVLFVIIYPMEWWCWIASPFIIVLNGTTEFILRRMNVVEPPRRHFVHSEEELKCWFRQATKKVWLEPEEEEMLHSVFDFSDTVASEIMTPRTDMTCVSANSTVRQFVDLALEKGHSRIPIYETDFGQHFWCGTHPRRLESHG